MPIPERFPVLETPRLRLREIVPSDAAAYFGIFGHVEHMRLFGVEPVRNLAAAQVLVMTFSGSHRLALPHIRWGVEAKREPRLIGSCGLFAWNKQWRKCSLGFALAEHSQGSGYMHEALSAALSWGFDVLGLNRIDAQVHPDNQRSIRVLQRLNFREEGRLRQFAYWDEQYHDMLQYSLLRSDRTA